MLFLTIISFLILQIIGYKVIDKYRMKYAKVGLLLFILPVLFVVLPILFSQKPIIGGAECGMPSLVIFLLCWVIGGGLSIVTHLVYYFGNRKSNNYKPSNNFKKHEYRKK